jgi:hypothetical protein
MSYKISSFKNRNKFLETAGIKLFGEKWEKNIHKLVWEKARKDVQIPNLKKLFDETMVAEFQSELKKKYQTNKKVEIKNDILYINDLPILLMTTLKEAIQ